MGTIARRIFVTVLLCVAVTIVAQYGSQSDSEEPAGRPTPLKTLTIEASPLEPFESLASLKASPQPASHLAADASPDGSAVRQASYSSLAFVAGAASIGQPADASAPQILHITEGGASPDVRWPVTQNRQEIRVRSHRIKVTFSALDANAKIRLQSDNGKYYNQLGQEVLEQNASLALDHPGNELNITLPAERQNLTPILVNPPNAKQRLLTLSIIPPESGGPTAATISHVFNNAHDHQVDGVNFANAARVPVFGDYLRIHAQVLENPQNLRFSLFRTDGNSTSFQRSFAPRTSLVLDNKMVSYELELPRDLMSPGVGGILLPHVIVAGKHAFSPSAQAIHFEVATSVPPLHPPTISAIHKVTQGNLDSTNEAEKFSRPNTWLVTPPTKAFSITGTAVTLPSNQRPDSRIILYEQVNGVRRLIKDETTQSSGFEINSSTGVWRASIPARGDGDYQYEAHIVQGNMSSPPSSPATVLVRSRGPAVEDVEPRNRLLGDGRINVTIFFSKSNPLDSVSAEEVTNYRITGPGIAAERAENPRSATFDRRENSVTLTFSDYPNDGTFTIFVDKNGGTNPLKDIYRNVLFLDSENATYYQFTVTRSRLADLPATQPGIVHRTGDYVPYSEFTQPRNVPDGFNPHDKVETRVVRLYYYRDAHRVAQIVNRKVKSFNRQGVDMQRQLADKARADAEHHTLARQELERAAIIKAHKTREAENELKAAEATLAQSIGALTADRLQNPAVDPRVDPRIQQFEATINATDQQVQRLRGQVQKLRDDEVAANERAVQAEAHEALARQEQFRREVSAAHADPDTYAAGKPTSDDPVEQVSVSVIGEGLIHLRGPLKGVNQIRTMIDQIDQPVGQARIAIHTIQINGEKNDRMEVVAKQVQQYIDHARFLTMQSAEMLRRAVVQVASRKAEEARMLYPGEMQEDRDRRYLHAFFGRDFIEELESIDSEFLRTGNKLLSLHSMDTTSLSSALNLMALARNSTRLEIFEEFDAMLYGHLPIAEANYMAAGMSHCSAKKHGWKCKHPIFCSMAQNAKFESLRGFFNMEIGHDETMTPLQREFVRLAQIFKNRLITELEYKQRVMERAIIEEKLGNRLADLRNAAEDERIANEALANVQEALASHRINALTTVQDFRNHIESVRQSAAGIRNSAQQFRDELTSHIIEGIDRYIDELQRRFPKDEVNMDLTDKLRDELRAIRSPRGGFSSVPPEESFAKWVYAYRERYVERKGFTYYSVPIILALNHLEGTIEFEGNPIKWEIKKKNNKAVVIIEDQQVVIQWAYHIIESVNLIRKAQSMISQFVPDRTSAHKMTTVENLLKEISTEALLASPDADSVVNASIRAQIALDTIGDVLDKVEFVSFGITNKFDRLLLTITDSHQIANDGYSRWQNLKDELLSHLVTGSSYYNDAKTRFLQSDITFQNLLRENLKLDIARQNAQASRRPLDHKKFLDMLIDDLEEKYIELLDGTRAHTANVDNYLKRLTTALDDDFNTQFYFPAFRYVREMSTSWDVQFGQTETTSILANNRSLAKVEPGATMEFDLPARDIVLTEALNGAKALMDDIGALANDPTFLAMGRMGSRSPADAAPGSTGGFGVVRNVIPGLQSSTAEHVMAHNAGARPQLGSNLENLIPDPAIYKFETGTGFEIRPVIQPDGQAVVFDFHYMYTTNVREPVRADEKHLGRVKRHFIDTDVQLSNFELRDVSRYTVALKAARTSRGVPLLEDIPAIGVLFRPLPSDESSLQQNLIMAQATIFPTLFDLMGLRWAPAVSDMDPLRMTNREFVVRNRNRALENRVYDYASSQVDEFLRIPEPNRRSDYYRSQETLPHIHPNGYQGPGLDLRDSQLQEGYQPGRAYPRERFIPGDSKEGAPFRPGRGYGLPEGAYIDQFPLEEVVPQTPDPEPMFDSSSRRQPR